MARIDDLTEDFWAARDGLDRAALHCSTVAALDSAEHGLTLGGLAAALPPTHVLETLAFWLGLGRETDAGFTHERETLEIEDRYGVQTRFDAPRVMLEAEKVAQVEPETLG